MSGTSGGAPGAPGVPGAGSAHARALSLQLTVNRAHSAARAGDLDQAARLLDELDTGGHLDASRVSFAKTGSGSGGDSRAERATVVAALNLRAKVHAQRGELTEADACWTRVEALAPGDPDAAAGRRTLAKIATGRRHARPVVNTGRVAVVAAALAATVAGVALVGGAVRLISDGEDDGGRASGSVTEADTGSERLRAESQRADELKERLAALESDNKADADRRDSTLDEAAERLAMPGVEIRRHADDIQLVFSTGVFPYDSVISREGATALTEIGRRLADLGSGPGSESEAGPAAGVETTVVGHSVAVPGGAPSGGSVVALERARVAAQYLAQDSDLRLTDFRLVSADQRRGPFPATEANAPRNRTVTLLITPKEPSAAR
ncbi:hypothetical protein GCM10011583_63180 [Streptomyces camponoticapitis]|uniref:OmpA-like domain-containing protein n=1 Tax=Streptomyces camponoticapitis TaxID=1616125 RepID=A0ABQ2ESH0_9ACTN|nr:hypothetical protein GCM10011583_63180 [Streptomyces camponoticapitis]